MTIMTTPYTLRPNLILALAVLIAMLGCETQSNRINEVDRLREAAEQGDAKAQFDLAITYGAGRRVQQDYREASNWFRKAALQGHAGAQLALGLLYYEGQGIPEDYRQAAKWIRLAAEQGRSMAQGQLGMMYAKGEGLKQDYVKAYAWTSVAAAQGEEPTLTPVGPGGQNEEKILLKTWLRGRMKARQIVKAQKLAGEIFQRIECLNSAEAQLQSP